MPGRYRKNHDLIWLSCLVMLMACVAGWRSHPEPTPSPGLPAMLKGFHFSGIVLGMSGAQVREVAGVPLQALDDYNCHTQRAWHDTGGQPVSCRVWRYGTHHCNVFFQEGRVCAIEGTELYKDDKIFLRVGDPELTSLARLGQPGWTHLFEYDGTYQETPAALWPFVQPRPSTNIPVVCWAYQPGDFVYVFVSNSKIVRLCLKRA